MYIGKLTTLAGMPDQGKSVVTCDIAARVTRGDEWPDGAGRAPQGSVIILSAEDDPEDTIAPRLLAAGAVMEKVYILNSLVTLSRGKRMFNIAEDLARLTVFARAHPDVRVLFVDPANAYMGTSKEHDSFRDSDVRAVLGPLKEWAEEYRVAVIIITHFKKGGTGRAIDQVMGSLAFTALSRSAWAFVEEKDADGKATGRKVMAKIKQNITEPVDALTYTLVGIEVAEGIRAPRVQWGEVVSGNADDVMGGAKPRPAQKLSMAIAFLRAQLSNGEKAAREIGRAAREVGFAEKTVARAKDELRVVSERTTSGWVWRLPEPADDFD
jgi:putative DNA primase/helicase